MKHRWLVVTLVGVLAMSTADAAFKWRRKQEPATLAELARRKAPTAQTAEVAADLQRAVSSYERFLQIGGTDPEMRAQALRRLGDLKLAMADDLRAEPSGAGSAAVMTQAAIRAYAQLLDEYPARPDAPEVLYQLARGYEALGDIERSLVDLDRLVSGYPASPLHDEAQFRRGEIFFSDGRYAQAEQAYAAVLRGNRDSDFRVNALYKHGWSLFKQTRDEESSQSFLGVLDAVLVENGRSRTLDDLSGGEREIATDSMRAMSVTFAAAEGVQSLQAALNRHGPAAYEPYLYRSLGDLYLEKERYQDAAETYRAFAKRQPMHVEAPLLLVAATEAYQRGGFSALVLDGKRELVAGYGPTSAFWKANQAHLDPRVVAAVETNLLDLAQHHHSLARTQGRGEDLNEAIRWYREYLAGFNESPNAPATRLLLADLLFDGQRFTEAAAEYELAAYSYASNPEAARAGYAALVSYEKSLPLVAASERASWQLRATDSSIKFADTFPTHPEVPAVLTRTTRTLFDGGDRVRAESVAQRVLALGSRATPEQQRVAWTVLASTYFDSERYADAEIAYGELVARIAPEDPERPAVVERLAASVYRQAEARQAAGDVAGAVDQFLRVAQVAPDSSIRATAEFDAATLLVNSGDWTRAATVLETFRRSHPGHALVADATRKLAVAYLQTGRELDAALELERVAAREGEDFEVRRTSLWQAAELYAQAQDRAAATRVYSEYVQRHPAPYDAAIEARQELADLAAATSDTAGRQRWLAEIVKADQAAGVARTDRSRLLAAHAALELAKPMDDVARAIRLTVPLDRALLAKKQSMEQALAAYSQAAQYGVAEVATPATYAIADLYQHLGKSLLESERPAGLAADELEQYDVLLEEQAFPFEEKAIEIHESNVRRATAGVYDEWVRKSYAALAELKPARYARSEVDPEAVSSMTPEPDQAAAAPPELTAELAVARVSLEAGRNAEVVDQLNATLSRFPTSAEAHNRLGIAYRRLGRLNDALQAYERAIAADPSMAAPHRNLAVLLDLYLAQPARALEHYERYQQLDGGVDQEAEQWLAELRARLNQTQRIAGAQP